MNESGFQKYILYHPCMVYLPTCTIQINQMQGSIPYMDGMGIERPTYDFGQGSSALLQGTNHN